jgi:hypothetical protein
MDQNGMIAGEVEQAIPVEIHHPASLAARQHGGIWWIEERASGIAAGEIPPELLEPSPGGRRALAVLPLFVGHDSSMPSFSTHTFIAK